MADSYTTLGIIKPARGDYFNTWDVPANLNSDMFSAAIAGETALALTGDTTLTISNGATDSGRAAIIRVSSSDQHDRVITVPAGNKLYTLVNDSAYRVKIKPSGGTATDVMPATEAVIRVTSAKAVRVATSGWGLFSSTATTSGTSVTITLTGLGQQFKDALLVFNDVIAGGAVQYLLRNDSASGGTTSPAGIGTATLIGNIEIPNYRAVQGAATSRLGATGASPYQTATTTSSTTVWKVTSGIGSVVVSLATGSFSGGAIETYLR